MQIIADFSLQLCQFEFISIIGASGCGKSTVLELFAGITKPDTGSIIFEGQDISGKSGFFGYMPQSDLLFPWLTLSENALLPITIQKKDKKIALERMRQLAEEFGLLPFLHHLPYQLSGGLKQRAALLRTCMFGSDILLLDEPFANLDALTRMALQSWLAEIRNKLGLSIILVTHDIDEAFLLSDRILIMGKTPSQIEKSYSKTEHQYQNPLIAASLKQEIIKLLS